MKKKNLSVIFFSILIMLVCSCSREPEGGAMVIGIDDRVKTLEEQAASIQISIQELTSLDTVIKTSIDALDSTILSLIEQEDELLSKLDTDWTAISIIRDSISIINGRIAILEKNDSTLEKKLADLQAYSDSLIYGLYDATMEWAEGTFGTLKQFDSLCIAVSTIQAQLDSLDEYNKKLVMESVSELEQTMKDWVNEQLNGYYSISQMDAKLEELSDADSVIKAEIETIKVDLDSMKIQMTREYEAAIETAIDSLEGVFDERINTKLTELDDEIQSQVDVINDRLTEIEERLDTMEDDICGFLSLVRSISVIPDFPDGSIKIPEKEYDFIVNLAIYPIRAADSIAKYKLPVAFEIQTAGTKSSFCTMEVLEITYDSSKSLLAVRVRSELPDAVKNKTQRAFGRVVFYNGKDRVASDFFPLTYWVELTGVEFVNSSSTISLNSTVSLPVKLTPENATDDRLTFRSLDLSTVWISSSGQASGLKAGTTGVIVSSVENPALCDTCEITVN